MALCYHKVGPAEEQGRRLNVHPRRLESHVRFFQRRGCTFVAARDLADAWPRRVACLTFDDAYVSALTDGVEVCRRCGVPATFYAVTNLVGQSSKWDGALARPLADWDLLRAAQKEGFEIGNHTVSHARLARLEMEEVRREVVEADARLRAEGIEPGSFCYPYGSLHDETLAEVAAAGYRVGMALGKRLPNGSDPLLALPRIAVAYGDALPLLLYRLYLRPALARRRRDG